MSKSFSVVSSTVFLTGLALVTQSFSSTAFAQAVIQETPLEVEVNPAQIQSLLREIEQASINDVSEEFIRNIVDNPQDKVAVELARGAIAEKLNVSMKTLSDVRQIIYRYLVVSSRISDAQQLASISLNYSNRASALYSSAISNLVPDTAWISGLMNRCATELCLSAIDNAMQDLLNFVRKSDQNLNVENSNRSMKLFWDFQDPLLRVSLKDTLRKILPPNQDHNLYKAVIAYTLSPLSLPVQALIEGGRKAAISIVNPLAQFIALDIARPNIALKYPRRNAAATFSTQVQKVISGERATVLAREAQQRMEAARADSVRAEENRQYQASQALEAQKRAAELKVAEEKKAADELQKKKKDEEFARYTQDKNRILDIAQKAFDSLKTRYIQSESKSRAASRSPRVNAMVQYIRSVPVKTLFREDSVTKLLNLSDLEIAQVLAQVPFGKCSVDVSGSYLNTSVTKEADGYRVSLIAPLVIQPQVPNLVRLKSARLNYNRNDWITLVEMNESELATWDGKKNSALVQLGVAASSKRSRELLTEIGQGLRVAIQNEACSAGMIPQAWACSAKCGGYIDGKLVSKTVTSEGRSRNEAWDDLKYACDVGGNHLYTKLDSRGALNVSETDAQVCYRQ